MVSCKTCPYNSGCNSTNKSDNFVAETCEEKDIWEQEELEFYEQQEYERQAEIAAMNNEYIAEHWDDARGDWIY